MGRAPNWTQDEFVTLLDNYRLSRDELAIRLGERSADAIAIVREGIHRFHTGQENCGILSQMMVRRLEERRGSLICQLCGVKF